MTAAPPPLEGFIPEGFRRGVPPEEIANAIKQWRDDGRRYGEEKLRESDPQAWFRGNSRIDSDVQKQLAELAKMVATEKVVETVKDEKDRAEFTKKFSESDGDPSVFEEGSDARGLAESLIRDVFLSPAFTLPDSERTKLVPITTEAGSILGDFEAQERPGGDGLDLLIRIDDEEDPSGSKRKAITIPSVTPDDIEAAKKEAEAEASRLRELEARSKAAGEEAQVYPSSGSLYTIGSLQRSAEEAAIRAKEQEDRAEVLSRPSLGKRLLLQERVKEAVQEDPDLAGKIGEVALGEDFWRGVQQTRTGIRMAALDIADLAGADVEEEKAAMREAIGALQQIYPGSTNLQFNEGIGGFTSEAAAVMGGMAPTLLVSGAAGVGAMASGARGLSLAAQVTSRAGGLSPIGLSAYGNSYAAMLNEADALEAQGDTAGAEQRRRDARSKAFLDAAIETGSELLFAEETLRLGKGSIVGKIATGAGQNTVEELIAATGQAETDLAYRDRLTSPEEIARAGALGAVVGGVMQGAGGVLESVGNRISQRLRAEQPPPETTDETPPPDVEEPQPEAPVEEPPIEPSPPVEEPVETAEPDPVEPDDDVASPEETTTLDRGQYPVMEVPLSEITLSTDVPNFKSEANLVTGVVPGQELGGTYQRLGTAPIVLWERLDGRKEVITGRHRLDLARRTGEQTIPSQIAREADGFTQEQALVFDAAANIRDGQGNIRDYADFFRNSPALTESEAQQSGLLSRAKGRAGWHLGKSASDDLYSLYRSGKITEARAVVIAETAPGNPEAQRIGVRYALDKKDPDFIANVMRASGAESAQRGEQLDLFGNDDAAMAEMERRATRASQFQRAIQDQITAAQSAAKRPEAARKMGIDVSDPAAVQARIDALRGDVARWQHWPMHGDLVELVKGDGPVTIETAAPAMESAPVSLDDPMAPAVQMIESALQDEASGSIILKSESVDESGRPVAALSYRREGSAIEIQHLGSTRPGEGRKLVNQAIEAARAAGVNSVVVDSGATAEGFYSRLGFAKEPGGKMRLAIDAVPTIESSGEGQLVPEAEMPFNLAGEVITEPEPIQPEDTRADAEKDADSGQIRLFEDREGSPPARSTGSPGASSAQASRAGGNAIRDTNIPAGTEPRAFTLPALVQLSKALGLDPTVNPNLRQALGRFVMKKDSTGKVTPEAVELRKGLFRDPDMAIEVLAHEIGHFIDYTEATLPRRKIHQRLAPLSKKNWESIFPTLAANFQGTPAKKIMAKALRAEAISLSSQWRGPFAPEDDYRNSAPELYADFLSALLNAPQWTRQAAPNLYEGFFNGLNQKPTVAAAYREMQGLLSGGLVTQRVLEKLDAAHEEGIDKLIQLSRPDAVPLRTRLRTHVMTFRQEFLNRWAPVSAKEGQFRRAAIGDSFTDQLEHNEGYAARQRSLFNDAIRTRVMEPLRAAGVDDAHFSRYLILNRIIKERRATGIWIEQNPDDARLIMGWLAEQFGSSSKIIDQILSAADESLYNVAARMIRELSDRGVDAEAITKVENKALFSGDLPEDLQGIAPKLITAFNVRGFMLNTEGIDVATAEEGLNVTRAEVGPEKWASIENASRELFAITRPIVEHAIDLGIYGEGVANEVIRPNLESYVPFQVLEYFDGDVSAAIKEGKGSVKALQDALTAVSLHTQSLMGWIQRQQTAMILEKWATTFGIPVRDSGPITKYSGRLKSDDGDVVMVWRNGRPHALTFEEPGIAKAANYFEELNFLAKLAAEGGGIFGRIFTKYAPGFIVYTNAIRDIQTQAERLGYRRTIRNAVSSARLANDYARAATGGRAMTPTIRRLVEEGILPPPDQSIGRILTESEMRQALNAGLSARDVAKGRVRAVKDNRINRLVEMADKPFVYLGAISESIGKITSEKSLREMGMDRASIRKLAKLQGIPNPGAGGTAMKSAAAWSLFFRVIIQGYRAERTFLLNPKTRGGYMLRMGIGQALPRILMFLAATGGLKALLEGMGYEPGDDLEEFYKSISQYKKEMGSVVPLFWLTPDGIEPVWGHTKDEIGDNWQAWGLRIPSSEGGRLWGSLTWNVLSESNEKTESPDAARTWTRWMLSHLPGLNPAIDTVSKNAQMAMGVNPVDSFRNRPVINQTDWNAGGWDRFGAIAKWNIGQVTGSFFRPEVASDTTGLSDVQKALQQIGPLRSMFTMDNYRQSRDLQKERMKQDQIAAKTRKALGGNATELLGMGSRLESMGSKMRTEEQEERYQLFLHFNRFYWEGKVGLREELKEAVASGNEAEIEEIHQTLEDAAEEYLGYMKAVK